MSSCHVQRRRVEVHTGDDVSVAILHAVLILLGRIPRSRLPLKKTLKRQKDMKTGSWFKRRTDPEWWNSVTDFMNNAEDVFDFLFSPWTNTQALVLWSEQMIKSNYENELREKPEASKHILMVVHLLRSNTVKLLWLLSAETTLLLSVYLCGWNRNTITQIFNIKSQKHRFI